MQSPKRLLQQATPAVKSADELRAEVRRLLETMNKISDPALKQELAGRAFLLAQEAEQIEELPEDPNIIRINIGSYRRRLSTGIDDPLHKQIIEELLRYAAEMLQRVGSQPLISGLAP